MSEDSKILDIVFANFGYTSPCQIDWKQMVADFKAKPSDERLAVTVWTLTFLPPLAEAKSSQEIRARALKSILTYFPRRVSRVQPVILWSGQDRKPVTIKLPRIDRDLLWPCLDNYCSIPNNLVQYTVKDSSFPLVKQALDGYSTRLAYYLWGQKSLLFRISLEGSRYLAELVVKKWATQEEQCKANDLATEYAKATNGICLQTWTCEEERNATQYEIVYCGDKITFTPGATLETDFLNAFRLIATDGKDYTVNDHRLKTLTIIGLDVDSATTSNSPSLSSSSSQSQQEEQTTGDRGKKRARESDVSGSTAPPKRQCV